jgi:hypothetical protein
MSFKTILIILATGFAISFLAVPAFRMVAGSAAIIKAPAPSVPESGRPD